jgi:hypothetical protein
VKQQDVDVARLDDLLAEWLPRLEGRVGALKMDVEGFEPWVLEGGQAFFRAVRPPFVTLELSSHSVEATNTTAVELLARLAEWGYEARLGAPDGPVVGPGTAILKETNGFLTLREGSRRRARRALGR